MIQPSKDYDEQEKQRTAASAAITGSSATKRLIVAGPGTGKSFTFRQALELCDGKGLALTFIRNLVADLRKDLGEVADVFTFHGYCKHLMHKHDVAGLRDGDYYPPLMQIVVDDILSLDGRVVKPSQVDEHLLNLNVSDGLIDEALTDADYYNAVSHTDAVYRVLRHFVDAPESIPKYPLVVVDEYQDFSLLETTFIELMSGASPVLIAGDDDQALYTTFRHASPEFIRELAQGSEFEVHELPYCSRCTQVVVDAVNTVITRATHPARGNLAGRLDKTFECYLPEKAKASLANPKIIQVDCSTANTSYVGQYIAQQIARIPAEAIQRSRSTGYPTALVIGPNPFLKRAFDVVRARFPQTKMKKSERVEIKPLDGYRRIARGNRSRLGWRIVMFCCPVDGHSEILKHALADNTDLVDGLPPEYVAKHLALARLVGLLLDGGDMDVADEHLLTSALDMTLDETKSALSIEESNEEGGGGELDAIDGADQADILFTTLVSSKGLSAEHVFIVGMNDGHFPRDPKAVSDEEVCSFLVALSRTRTRCHVISCKFFGTAGLKPSLFLSWIKPHTERLVVKKGYDFSD
jgi:ATP-dependent DNA helicase UvrD/PcrA